jgi:NADH-quinone oxidoreductase subunit N
MFIYIFSEIYLIFVLCFLLPTGNIKLNKLSLIWFLFLTLSLTLGVPEWDRSLNLFNLLLPESELSSLNASYHLSPYIVAVRSLITLLFSFYFLLTFEPLSQTSRVNGQKAEAHGNYLLLIILLSLYLLLSSYDLILLYINMELLALSSYLLSFFQLNTPSHSQLAAASEASFKYYIMGSISSSFFLLGTSLVYGVKGTINFQNLFELNIGVYDNDLFFVGIIFIIFYFLFKLSIFPFHQWTPDVFQGVHINITAFFALLPKSVFFFLLPYLVSKLNLSFATSLTSFPVGSSFYYVATILALISILIGSFLGLLQSSLKRLLAYSSISNGGFMLLALSTNSFVGYNSFFFYLIIYFISSLGLFCSVIHYRVNSVQDLKYLVYINPIFTFNFSLLLFSLAGVPPLAGFISKFQIFYSLFTYRPFDSFSIFIIIVFLSLFLSLFAAFYYLRLIHFFYFFPPSQSNPTTPFVVNTIPSYILSVSGLLLLFGGLYPYPFLDLSTFLTLCL